MKVLVTGATGYVGAAVVRRLEADGHAVRPFSRASGGDIADPASVEEAMDGVDAAVNLVAILEGSPEQFDQVVAGGARNVVAAARAAGVRRLLHMSALGVTQEHAPLTGYWGAKWKAKRAVIESDLRLDGVRAELRLQPERRGVRRVRAPDPASGRAGDRERALSPPAGVAGRRRGRVLARARAARDDREGLPARRAAGVHVRRAARRDRARDRPPLPPQAARPGGVRRASRPSSSCAGCRRRSA